MGHPSTSLKFDLINPSREETWISVAAAQADDMNRAITSARHAFDKGPWRKLSAAERAKYLTAMADVLDKRTADASRILSSESGAILPLTEAVHGAALMIYRLYAGMADTFEFEEIHKPGFGANYGLLVREPVGVVGAIVPWNAPELLVASKVAPALLAGCTVILKASPEAPGSAYLLAEAAAAVGLPKGVINVVTADREVSEILVRSPDVDKITFTGSSAAGKKIAALCGERIARCTLELGGKSAAIVLDDYDLGKAAENLAGQTAVLTGQVCSALTRVIVSRHRHDAFVDALSSAFGKIKIGDPFDEGTQMGPLAMARQRDVVENFVAQGKAEGATIATGGGRPANMKKGFFFEPTVFANVDNSMTIAREEIFGPVISVIAADDETQAVEIANDSPFGLNAAVFTNDIDRAYHTAREIRSGTVGHNGVSGDFTIAFGGFKQSGLGREGGREGLLPFLETKTVLLDGAPKHRIA